uniref:Transposon Ty3-I Gag-Pol polyprotein n=1 Tax=Tanacetum cinerariifolium TaxID=118510 RepID=A0A6L2P5E0_TANCI|nr:transposon Ty3-I Gag-Pol polyprotein [Tanacetum cinerariifolium]
MRIAMVPPKVTPQLPKLKVKVEEKIFEAEVVNEHVDKIQDVQSYKQHDDKISTLLFGTRNKVGMLKYEGFRVDVKHKSIKDKVHREKVFKVDEALDIENSRASYFQELYASDEDFHNTWMELETNQHRDHGLVGYPFDYRVTLGFGSIVSGLDHVNPVIRLPLKHGISKSSESKSEDVGEIDIETLTLEHYLTLNNTRGRISHPENAIYEIKGQFLRELRKTAFSGSSIENAIEHIEKVLEVASLFNTNDSALLNHGFVGYPFNYRVTLGFGSIAGGLDHVNLVIRLPFKHGISRVLQDGAFHSLLKTSDATYIARLFFQEMIEYIFEFSGTARRQTDGQTAVANVVHSSTGFSPFEVVYKTSLRRVVDLVDLPGKKNIQANRMVEEVQATHEVKQDPQAMGDVSDKGSECEDMMMNSPDRCGGSISSDGLLETQPMVVGATMGLSVKCARDWCGHFYQECWCRECILIGWAWKPMLQAFQLYSYYLEAVWIYVSSYVFFHFVGAYGSAAAHRKAIARKASVPTPPPSRSNSVISFGPVNGINRDQQQPRARDVQNVAPSQHLTKEAIVSSNKSDAHESDLCLAVIIKRGLQIVEVNAQV